MNDIKDVKPPIDVPDLWRLLAMVLLAAAVAALVILWVRRRNSRPRPAASQAPEMPAWEKAYQQLEALQKENLPEKGQFREFFTRVSDIARHYMEDRFNIRAPQMSSEEFLYDLAKRGALNEKQNAALKDFLTSCDMVKFAKYAPTLNEARQNFDSAKGLVDDTRI